MPTWALIFALLLVPSVALADCGEITKKLFGIEIGGPRSYLTALPAGLSLSNLKQNFGNAGIDHISGKSAAIDLMQAQIWWHENRVVSVLATIRGLSENDIDEVRKTIVGISGKEFNPKAVPANEFLSCTDRISARVVKSKIVRSKDSVIPILMLAVEDPKQKSAMTSTAR